MLVSTSDKDRILNDKDLVTLFKAFVDNGYEIRLVGGSVRDMLIGKDIKDIDMARITSYNVCYTKLLRPQYMN